MADPHELALAHAAAHLARRYGAAPRPLAAQLLAAGGSEAPVLAAVVTVCGGEVRAPAPLRLELITVHADAAGCLQRLDHQIGAPYSAIAR